MAGLDTETRGMMLLTATPEQMGLENHFAQLKLLDPCRYHDFSAFVAELEGHKAVAQQVGKNWTGESLQRRSWTLLDPAG